MGSKRVPEVRFNGFSEEWQVCKLFEVAEFNPRSSLPEQFRYVDLGSVVGTNLISYRTELKKTAPSRAQRLAKRGDVFYQMVRPYQKNNFLFDLPYADFVFSTGYAQLRPYGNSYFLLSRLQESRFVSNVLDRSTGTSYPAINSNDLAQIEITVPKKEVEQTQIGNFFKQLDETVTIQQQELDTLKQTKQGFLQKMFPKEGEFLPQIRFSGFSGEWEERNFFDNINSIFDFRGRTPKKLGLDWSKSGYLALSALNVKNGYIDLNVDAYYGDEELYKKWMGDKILKQGQVLFTTEAPMGNVAQVPDNKGYILSQRTIAFEVDDAKITNDFLSILLRSPTVINQLYSMSSGGTAKGVSQKSLSKLKILVPKSLEEQAQIASFFKQLDETIALQEKELNTLKQTKKAFLQKMFV
ncbi:MULTISPECIES: restriction endonuclease subunit S [Bacillus]|uniref:restriction endonuclease subunit S n=1 Tax=Bacillus TaxID=1386 RepID=UPI000626CF23|nr:MULTISPECIES: restriction endonuclease subunit S [Bacillus]KKK11765.1 type I restriction modification protein subunit S [Bacillus sp. L_1B0_12]MEC1010002.1 restriction endonuclease subunit S [Bacillus altitudinis]CVM38508.1 restriction-modification enzyme type I S subunit [Streptococcus pneumoniae]